MVALAIVIAALGFVLRVYAPGPTTETTDEPVYLPRTDAFRQALVSGDLAGVTAVYRTTGFVNDTIPAITTMWAGTLGRAAAVASGEVGLSHRVVGPSDSNAAVLRADRAVVALWCSIALGMFVYLAWRLFGRGTASVAGVLLATEPWLVGHSGVLHTDAMVTMFSADAVLALAVGLGLATRGTELRSLRSGRHRRRRWSQVPHGEPGWALASGVWAGLAALTKLNAIVMVVPGAAVIAGLVWQRHRESLSAIVRTIVLWLAASLATFVAAWPALWVAPAAQFSAMRHSLGQLSAGHLQFFLGHVTYKPGPAYYFVVFWYRATPWLATGLLLAIGLCIAKLVHRLRPSRPLDRVMQQFGRIPLWPLGVCVPYLAAITWSAKKLDRYLLPVFPLVAVVVGAIVTATVLAIASSHRWHNWIGVAGAVGAIALAINVGVQAPYAVSYVDPLVGGQRTASHAIVLGWGEGMERLGATIAREQAGRCDATVVAVDIDLPIAIPCGHLVGVDHTGHHVTDYDLVITYFYQEQRSVDRRLVSALRHRAVVIDRVTIDGLTYAELWRVRKVGADINAAAQ